MIRRFHPSDEAQVRALHELALRGVGALIQGPDAEALDRDLHDINASYIGAGGDFLVDDVDDEALSACDLCCKLYISLRCPAIDVQTGLDAMAAQKG